MTKDEWVAKYEKSVGVTFDLQPGETFVFNEDKGFTAYILKPEEETLIITKMIGDGEYWCKGYSSLLGSVSAIGIDKLYYTTFRNPRAFCKLLGGIIHDHVERDDGRILWGIISTTRMVNEALSRRWKHARSSASTGTEKA